MLDILKECQGAKRIAIGGHIRPDGDCVGSTLALYRYLQKATGAQVTVFLENPPEVFAELSGFEDIDSKFEDKEPFDVFFVLDCAYDRLGEAEKYYHQAHKTINIDHHISNSGCGDLSLVIPDASSACEVVYGLLEKKYVDAEIAKSIYVGMIHDCGVFQYSNTSPKTMRMAADLMEYGFDFPRIIQESFYQKTYDQTQIMGRALMESIRFLDGQCIVSAVDRKTMEFYNATSKDLDGIVNQLKNIKGVHCAVFMYETNTLEYKVSMRSDERVDVSKVAAQFGGGGHMRAAGCTMEGTFHDCINNLSLPISKQLEA